MFKKLATLLAGAALMAICVVSVASATQISGTIDFFDPRVALLKSGAPATVGTVTFLDFSNNAFVSAATDDLSALVSSPVTLTDLALDGSALPAIQWTIGSYSFLLESLTIDLQTSSFLNLTGKGVLSAAGFEDTAADWSLTITDSSQVKTITGSIVTTDATPVPEPGTMVLLGAGMLGLAIFGKRRMNREA